MSSSEKTSNATPSERVQNLESMAKAELKQLLSEELGDQYQRQIPGSLRNDFLEACCASIKPGTAPIEVIRTHPEFSPSWRTKKQLATALRMVLSEAGVRKSRKPLTSLTRTDLAQIIVAIRLSEEDSLSFETETPSVEPPSRPAPPDSQFSDVLYLEGATEEEVRYWVERRKPDVGGDFAVYTLDCTPPLDNEWKSIQSFRADVDNKTANGEVLGKMDQAASALNNGERVYYVGFTNDVVDRVGRHRGGASHGSGKFTNTFRPQALVDIEWYESEQEARRNESIRARTLTTEGQRFAYWE